MENCTRSSLKAQSARKGEAGTRHSYMLFCDGLTMHGIRDK